MLFENILVAVDGSKFGQYAADFGFRLGEKLGSQIAIQHVVDPRLVDMFVEPEFAAELGFTRSLETTDKVVGALRKMGRLVLQLCGDTASCHALKVDAFLDEGYILDEILKRSEKYDLVILGHRGRGSRPMPTELLMGSVAERIAAGAKTPVLVAADSPENLKQVLVAYDGSEPSVGALLMSEQLARALQVPLKALFVVRASRELPEAHLTIQQGEKYLREKWDSPVFHVMIGKPAELILEEAARSKSLLVLGAYGFGDPERTVMGGTATSVVRRTSNSVLIYR